MPITFVMGCPMGDLNADTKDTMSMAGIAAGEGRELCGVVCFICVSTDQQVHTSVCSNAYDYFTSYTSAVEVEYSYSYCTVL